MATYLINISEDQFVVTREHGRKDCFAFSNPGWYTSKPILGADFGKIVAGDRAIICRAGKLQTIVLVERVEEGTDVRADSQFQNQPVRFLVGRALKRLGVSVEAAAKRASQNGAEVPPIINANQSGFKQGAFCCALNEKQALEYANWP